MPPPPQLPRRPPFPGFDFAFMSGFCTSAARLGTPDTGLLSYGEMVEQVRLRACVRACVRACPSGGIALERARVCVWRGGGAQLLAMLSHLPDPPLQKKCTCTPEPSTPIRRPGAQHSRGHALPAHHRRRRHG